MAVRDEQPLKEARRVLPLREMLKEAAAVFLAAGILIYGILSSLYDEFYGPLGIDPNDVGLSYTGTLARSSGFVILCLFVVLCLYSAYFYFSLSVKNPGFRIQQAFMILLALIFVSIGMTLPIVEAQQAARKVLAGKPVHATRILGPVLAIRADPVTVESVGKPGDSPAADRLQGKKLLYLGQSGGTVVLYDATVRRAIYVPASSIILQIANCRVNRPPDATC